MMCSLSTMNAIKLFSESNFCHSSTYTQISFSSYDVRKILPFLGKIENFSTQATSLKMEEIGFSGLEANSVECVKWKYLNERQSRFQSASLVSLMMSQKINFFFFIHTTSKFISSSVHASVYVFIFQNSHHHSPLTILGRRRESIAVVC